MLGALVAAVVTSSALLAAPEGAVAPPEKPIAPQAEPVLVWLKAAKTADQTLLKTVFSGRMRMQFDVPGWEKVAGIYKRVFADLYGDYRPEDFTFEYDGTAESGNVTIIHLGKKRSAGVHVIREEGAWKVNER